MLKILLNITLVLLVLSINLIPAYSQDGKTLILEPVNILEPEQIDIAIDGTSVNYTVVKENDILYIDSGFFTDYFKKSTDDFKKAGLLAATLKEGTKDITCLPIIKALNLLGMRYTYNPIFSKDIMRIRTDNAFKVDSTYVYKPTEDGSHGNLPDTSNNNTQSYNYPVTYSPSVYSVAPGYGYYYPPGYQPGFYFGSYGFINQGPVTPSIYNGPVITPVNNVIDF